MSTRNQHRSEVLGKSHLVLDNETHSNDIMNQAKNLREKKIDRARRRLEKLKHDNLGVDKQIERQVVIMKS